MSAPEFIRRDGAVRPEWFFFLATARVIGYLPPERKPQTAAEKGGGAVVGQANGPMAARPGLSRRHRSSYKMAVLKVPASCG